MPTSEVTRFLGESVDEAQLTMIRGVVVDYPGLSRMELAATVCEVVGWIRPSGRPRTIECRQLLERLEAAGALSLPPKRPAYRLGTKTSIPHTAAGEARAEIVGTAGDLGPITVELVVDAAGRRLVRELLGRYHYLGYRTPFGAQLRYLAYGSKPERQVVGCLLFTSAAWRLAERDGWIGWDDETRGRGLSRIVSNGRFLVLPWLRVRNLASTILSRAVSRLPADWRATYGVEPVLVETLVDESRFRGTCYLASNWIELGRTAGRGRMDRRHEREGAAPKRLFVYPLVSDARDRLRGE